ncbi:MAG TPA: SDR family oxidoreductase [Microthrixaceae bacterium]|nr:SDR family oxidoreductase [Microthrixaceae bacterium]
MTDRRLGNGYLDGRVVVITGAGGGFGRLVAEMSAERGAHVVISDIDPGAAEDAAASIRSSGGEAEAIEVDVRDLAQMRSLAARTIDRFGAIDVMVNNAGIMPLAFLADHEQAAEAWDRCIDINFKGVLNGICAVHDQMINQGRGHIVNISSIYGNTGTAGSGVYSATKAAVSILSDSLRKESQGKIKVTTVRPTGVLGTGLSASVVNPAATIGIVGPNSDAYIENVMSMLSGTLEGPESDIDQTAYWAITPESVAAEVVHVIDQPWGVTISDITIRATGEQYVI